MHQGDVWTVRSSFNTNIEGMRANLRREMVGHTENCSVNFSDLEVIG